MITIDRIYTKTGTLGSLIAKKGNNIVLFANTIELPWRDNKRRVSCIPEGEYDVVPWNSPSKGHVFKVKDVPGRSDILIHVANFVYGQKIDLLGCIAPASYIRDINGDTFVDGVHSGEIMRILLKMFPNGFKLKIQGYEKSH